MALIVIIAWAAWLNKDHNGFITVPNLVIDIVSVLVSMIPEGLPACVTIALAISASTLGKRKILCKSLMTVETLGAVTVLCSDKTGTLTTNRMTVVNATVLDQEYTTMEARDSMVRGDKEKVQLRQLAAVAGVCNAATFGERISCQDLARMD